MERILEISRLNSITTSVHIADVGGGAATLYLLNGGRRPRTPTDGDFAYDFANATMQLFDGAAWATFSIEDVNVGLRRPTRNAPNASVVSFTPKGLPYWTPSDEDLQPCDYGSVDQILQHFRERFDAANVQISERAKRRKHSEIKDGGNAETESVDKGNDSRMSKRRRTQEGLTDAGGKDSPEYLQRFVTSSLGFPQNSEKIRWDGGFETYMPFCGKGTKDDEEGAFVRAAAACPSLERFRSEGNTSDPETQSIVSDLIVEIDVHDAIRNPEKYDGSLVTEKWTQLVEEIEDHMSRSTAVVIRRWTPKMQEEFSHASVGMLFGGDLGFDSLWVDGTVLAANRDRKRKQPYHRMTTLAEFLDLVPDTSVCGNYLDGKDMNQSPPAWAKPLFDNSTAWSQTAGLRWTVKAAKNRQTPVVKCARDPPSVIRAGTWSSQAWRLVSQPGYLSDFHYDCCGMDTHIKADLGAKIWIVGRPKRDACPATFDNLVECLSRAGGLSDDGDFPDGDIAAVCLEQGDVMFQPAGVLHAVYTPVPAMFTGGYFYNYQTMHLSRAVLHMPKMGEKDALTNDHRVGYLRTLCRMLIALRYRSKPRKIGKRSLLSLALIVLEAEHPEQTSDKTQSALAEEERGDLAFAKESAESLLKWLRISPGDAKQWVVAQGAYYLPGEDVVVLPAVPKGSADPIFPSLM